MWLTHPNDLLPHSELFGMFQDGKQMCHPGNIWPAHISHGICTSRSFYSSVTGCRLIRFALLNNSKWTWINEKWRQVKCVQWKEEVEKSLIRTSGLVLMILKAFHLSSKRLLWPNLPHFVICGAVLRIPLQWCTTHIHPSAQASIYLSEFCFFCLLQ